MIETEGLILRSWRDSDAKTTTPLGDIRTEHFCLMTKADYLARTQRFDSL